MAPDSNPSPGEDDADQQRHDEAVADCTEAIRLAPDDPLLYLERGKARSNLGRHEEALEDYDRIVSLDPNLPGVTGNQRAGRQPLSEARWAATRALRGHARVTLAWRVGTENARSI